MAAQQRAACSVSQGAAGLLAGNRALKCVNSCFRIWRGVMIVFCPTCGNMLLVEINQYTRELQYACQTCPYMYLITKKITRAAQLPRKGIDDIMSSEDAFKGAPKTEAVCPECGNKEAMYREMQTRSADEPMTVFYHCCECQHVWKEG